MKIYLINILFLLIWAYCFKNNKKIYCTVAAAQWILLSGLRDYSVGADTYAYYYAFERLKHTSWATVLSNLYVYIKNPFAEHNFKDPGYKFVEKVFQIFFKDYRLWLIFIAALFTVSMAVWIYKNSEMPWLSFIIYSALFYSFYAVTGHRQTIATALVVFIGYKYIKERKLWKFLAVSFIAFLIHKSSIVFVPFYFIANMDITALKSVFILGGSFLFSLIGKPIYAPLAYTLGFGEEQIEESVGGAETYATILLLICIFTLVCYPFVKDRRDDSKFLYNAMFMTIFTTLFVYQQQAFMRVQQYYSLFIMIMIPEIVMSFEKKQRILVGGCGTLVLMLYLVMQNPHYMFFFQ